MENVRNCINMVLINNDLPKLKRYTAKPNFKKATIFNDPDIDDITDCNMCAVHMSKNEVTLNKPIMVGQAILDLSKLHMYGFYYNVLKNNMVTRSSFCLLILTRYAFRLKLRIIIKILKNVRNTMTCLGMIKPIFYMIKQTAR